jgi:DNA polymerase-3 subunit delta
MPAAATRTIYLLGGDDEFSIKEAAARLAATLAPKAGGEFATEIIEGDAPNQDAALQLLARVREALFSGGLFGGGQKLVWWKNTDLLADNVTTRGEAVKEALGDLAERLKRGLPDGTRLLISAIGLDRRRAAYKTIEKLGEVRLFEAPDPEKQAGQDQIAEFLQQRLKAEGKKMTAQAADAFLHLVAPTHRELANELEKLFVYVGARTEITAADVRAIVSPSRQAVMWELTDALGMRRLPAALRALEQLLAQGEQPIRIVMMLVGQFRLMLLARDLAERKVLVPRDGPGGNFEYVKAYEKLPATATAHLPRTKEGQLPNGWRLYRCALGAKHFTSSELIRALDLLLEAHLQLVSTQLDQRLVLEETLAKIARPCPR